MYTDINKGTVLASVTLQTKCMVRDKWIQQIDGGKHSAAQTIIINMTDRGNSGQSAPAAEPKCEICLPSHLFLSNHFCKANVLKWFYLFITSLNFLKRKSCPNTAQAEDLAKERQTFGTAKSCIFLFVILTLLVLLITQPQ